MSSSQHRRLLRRPRSARGHEKMVSTIVALSFCEMQSSHSDFRPSSLAAAAIFPDAAELSLKTSRALRNAAAATSFSPSTIRERISRVQPSTSRGELSRRFPEAIDHRSDRSVLRADRLQFGRGHCLDVSSCITLVSRLRLRRRDRLWIATSGRRCLGFIV